MEDSGADGPASSDNSAGPEQSQLGLKTPPGPNPKSRPGNAMPPPRSGEAGAMLLAEGWPDTRGLVMRTQLGLGDTGGLAFGAVGPWGGSAVCPAPRPWNLGHGGGRHPWVLAPVGSLR